MLAARKLVTQVKHVARENEESIAIISKSIDTARKNKMDVN